MVDLRDGFLRELDKEPSGIQGHINNYTNILSYIDPELHEVIEGNQIPHQFYCLRWFMLLLCQDFDIGETMRLWDTLLAAEGPNEDENPMISEDERVKRFAYIDFVVVAAVMGVRDKVVKGNDFATGMETL